MDFSPSCPQCPQCPQPLEGEALEGVDFSVDFFKCPHPSGRSSGGCGLFPTSTPTSTPSNRCGSKLCGHCGLCGRNFLKTDSLTTTPHVPLPGIFFLSPFSSVKPSFLRTAPTARGVSFVPSFSFTRAVMSFIGIRLSPVSLWSSRIASATASSSPREGVGFVKVSRSFLACQRKNRVS